MNFPGYINADPACLDKSTSSPGAMSMGMRPLLRGGGKPPKTPPPPLYRSRHSAPSMRATSAGGSAEKIRKGMTVLIREGSVFKDLQRSPPLLDVATSPFLAFLHR